MASLAAAVTTALLCVGTASAQFGGLGGHIGAGPLGQMAFGRNLGSGLAGPAMTGGPIMQLNQQGASAAGSTANQAVSGMDGAAPILQLNQGASAAGSMANQAVSGMGAGGAAPILQLNQQGASAAGAMANQAVSGMGASGAAPILQLNQQGASAAGAMANQAVSGMGASGAAPILQLNQQGASVAGSMANQAVSGSVAPSQAAIGAAALSGGVLGSSASQTVAAGSATGASAGVLGTSYNFMSSLVNVLKSQGVLLASPESSSCSADGCTTTVVSPTSAAVAGTVTYSFNCSAQHTVPVVAALTAEAPCNVCRMSVAPSVTVSLAALPTTAAASVEYFCGSSFSSTPCPSTTHDPTPAATPAKTPAATQAAAPAPIPAKTPAATTAATPAPTSPPAPKQVPPSAIEYLGLVNAAQGAVKLCWDKPSSDGGCPISYVVQMTMDGKSSVITPTNFSAQCLNLTDVTQCKDITFSVAAVNCAGKSQAATLNVAAGDIGVCKANVQAVEPVEVPFPLEVKTQTAVLPLAVAKPEPTTVCASCNPFVLSTPVPAPMVAQVYGKLKDYRGQITQALVSKPSGSTCALPTLVMDALCTDSCPGHNHDGVCDEGKACALGTDCSDCGAAAPTAELDKMKLLVQNALVTCPSLAQAFLQTLVADASGHAAGQGGGCDGSVQYELTTINQPQITQAVQTLQVMQKQLTQQSVQASLADLVAVAATEAVRWMGGPAVDVQLGRIDATSANTLPSCMSEANYFADAGKTIQVASDMGLSQHQAVALCAANSYGSLNSASPFYTGWAWQSAQNLLAVAASPEPATLAPALGSYAGFATQLAGVSGCQSTIQSLAADYSALSSSFATGVHHLCELGARRR